MRNKRKHQLLKSLYRNGVIIKKFETWDKIKFNAIRKILKILYTFQRSFRLALYYISYKLLKLQVYTSCKMLSYRKIFIFPLDRDGQSFYLIEMPASFQEVKTSIFLIKELSKNDIFYDIGANYGYYSIIAQEIIDKGEIHVFEPNKNILPLLKRNLNLKKYRNTFLNNVAISNKNGKIEFYDRILDFHSGGSSIVKEAPSKNERYLMYKVKTITLDEYTKKHKPPTFIKIDVEGAEKLVIKGGIKTLKKYNPKIIMEVFTDKEHISAVKMLLKLGYKMYYIDEKGDYHRVNENIIKRLLNGEIFLQDNYLFMK